MSTIAGSTGLTQRSGADVAMRRLLRVPDVRPTKGADEAAQRLFSTSILISATRCLLFYVIFPFVLPALVGGVEPIIGIPLGLVALVFDVMGIRRFFVADHRWRWPITALYFAIMVLVIILLVIDVTHVV